MTRILIRRSDGRIQYYRVKKSNYNQMHSLLETVKFHGKTRKRRIYVSTSVLPKSKEKVYPTIINRQEYSKVIYMTTDRPIHGEPCQVHVRLRAWKDGKYDEADGYSHRLDMERQFKRGKHQAIEHALLEMGYFVDTDYYSADAQTGNGRPDGYKVLKLDFVSVVKK